jgi:uncharacterized membrane protein YccC
MEGRTRRARARAGGFGTVPKRIEAAERRAKLLRLRRAGLTIRQIHQRMPEYKDEKALRADLRKVLKDMIDLPAQELLALQYHRLEVLIQSLWKAALEGDLQTHDRVLKLIMEQNRFMNVGAKNVGEDDGSDVSKWLEALINDAAEAEAEDIGEAD